MRFLADMAILLSTVAWLRDQGHDVTHLRDDGLQRAEDSDVLEKARTEDRTLLTLDLDFGYLMAISGQSLPSIIIFRLGNESAKVVTQRLTDTLGVCIADLEQGAIVTVSEDKIRVRHLPIAPD
jgi:predicted nuclease of predicted toxin-antitoxin system